MENSYDYKKEKLCARGMPAAGHSRGAWEDDFASEGWHRVRDSPEGGEDLQGRTRIGPDDALGKLTDYEVIEHQLESMRPCPRCKEEKGVRALAREANGKEK